MIMCINYEKIEETRPLDLLAMPIQVLLEESWDGRKMARKTPLHFLEKPTSMSRPFLSNRPCN